MSLTTNTKTADDSLLGKETTYADTYTPSLLFPIARAGNREAIGLAEEPPFNGHDLWSAFELSWLRPGGKPQIATADISVPCNSPCLIESKSLKLYLNSFNQSAFESTDSVLKALTKDLSEAAGATVSVALHIPESWNASTTADFDGECIDALDIETDTYEVDPQLLTCEESDIVEETLFSRLFRSNCLVTGQPDWASVLVRYRGPRIDRASLLRYLISYRQHQGFHEQCIERIYMDLTRECSPEQLTVYGRFTRRGGLDINPFRSNFEATPGNNRQHRQ